MEQIYLPQTSLLNEYPLIILESYKKKKKFLFLLKITPNVIQQGIKINILMNNSLTIEYD